MATRPTLAQETVSENRRFPSKSKQTKSQVNNASSQLYTDQKESGEWEARVLSSNYMYTLVNESQPFM